MPDTASPSPASVSRLHLRRSGGLAGLKAEADVAADVLSPAQQRALAGLLHRPPGAPTAPSRGADRYQWQVQLHLADGTLHTLVLSEDEMPDALATLVRPEP